jgi:membrane associated rhomboid family serine protease
VILRRLLYFLTGAAALSVSAGVVVVALAYALYALVKPAVGPAGASGIVAGAAAVLIGLIGLVLTNMARPPKKKPGEPESIVDRIVDFVRSKPVTSLGAAIAAGILAVRNPGYLGMALRSFVEGRQPPRKKGR